MFRGYGDSGHVWLDLHVRYSGENAARGSRGERRRSRDKRLTCNITVGLIMKGPLSLISESCNYMLWVPQFMREMRGFVITVEGCFYSWIHAREESTPPRQSPSFVAASPPAAFIQGLRFGLPGDRGTGA